MGRDCSRSEIVAIEPVVGLADRSTSPTGVQPHQHPFYGCGVDCHVVEAGGVPIEAADDIAVVDVEFASQHSEICCASRGLWNSRRECAFVNKIFDRPAPCIPAMNSALATI